MLMTLYFAIPPIWVPGLWDLKSFFLCLEGLALASTVQIRHSLVVVPGWLRQCLRMWFNTTYPHRRSRRQAANRLRSSLSRNVPDSPLNTKDLAEVTEHLTAQPLSKVIEKLNYSGVIDSGCLMIPPRISLISGIIQFEPQISPKSIL